jgi:hypothetical protein
VFVSAITRMCVCKCYNENVCFDGVDLACIFYKLRILYIEHVHLHGRE